MQISARWCGFFFCVCALVQKCMSHAYAGSNTGITVIARFVVMYTHTHTLVIFTHKDSLGQIRPPPPMFAIFSKVLLVIACGSILLFFGHYNLQGFTLIASLWWYFFIQGKLGFETNTTHWIQPHI